MLQYSLKRVFKSLLFCVLLLLLVAFDILDTIPETEKFNCFVIGQITYLKLVSRCWDITLRNRSKGPSIKYVYKIFRRTNISNPLMRTRMRAYQGVRNVSFSANFAYVLNGWPVFIIKNNILLNIAEQTYYISTHEVNK